MKKSNNDLFLLVVVLGIILGALLYDHLFEYFIVVSVGTLGWFALKDYGKEAHRDTLKRNR